MIIPNYVWNLNAKIQICAELKSYYMAQPENEYQCPDVKHPPPGLETTKI